MKKSDLIDELQQVVGSRAAATKTLESLLGGIAAALTAGDSVSLSGFGTFKVQTRAAREGRNPKTGESVTIPEKHVVKFTPASALKAAVN